MVLERELQKTIIRWLRSKKCIVLKYQQNATTRSGVPDLVFLKDGFWGAIEVKRCKTAKYRPGQKEMIARMNEMSWAKAVWPENWADTRAELEEILR